VVVEMLGFVLFIMISIGNQSNKLKRGTHAGVGKSHFAALFIAQAILDGSEVLLECVEVNYWGKPPLGRLQTNYYWLPSSGNHTNVGVNMHVHAFVLNRTIVLLVIQVTS